jgi:hypothetical protein
MAKKRNTMKGKDNLIQKAGSWAFIGGVVLALIAGMYPIGTALTAILVILGLLVGFLNVTGKETNSFLFASLVLVVMGGFGGQVFMAVGDAGILLANMLSAILLFVIPSALVVSLKAIYVLAETE